ncbi:MAG: hypothetical protein A2Y10_07175 [Planctomycetes bacterium GWF2_41_51]|nr:MAG: hypothetical protein A2Y10_07175 [Planctomycetes bacterium GWF2_41_51]HBG28510.1 hypothetical protein [Phycisphaerales bacterium]
MSILNKRPSLVISFPVALIFYAIFAALLFFPVKQNLSQIQYLLPFAAVIGASGVFILCRRWVLSIFASLAGGAVYGFGTYACSLFCYHPFAALVYSLLPWTLIPAVFFYRWTSLDRINTNIISGLLVFLSVLFILSAYRFASMKYFYPIPVQTHLTPKALIGVIDPIGVKQDIFAPGFYHVTMAGMVMGIGLLIKTRRFATILLFIIAAVAAFYKPILNVPPVVWTSIPVLICSIVIAAGLETIILAGEGDGKWLLGTILILLLLSVADVFLSHHSSVIPLTAALYGVGITAVVSIYFIAEAGKAWHLLRMFILYSAIFLDIFISTRHNLDTIF